MIGEPSDADLQAYRDEEYRRCRDRVNTLLAELRRDWLDDPYAVQLELAVADLAVAAFSLGVQSGG